MQVSVMCVTSILVNRPKPLQAEVVGFGDNKVLLCRWVNFNPLVQVVM